MEAKTIYNPDSEESLQDRRVFGGNPSGMLDFTHPKYIWATNLWDTMEGNTWFN
jgi:ribonucleoside-diphosphate reductase beta chain